MNKKILTASLIFLTIAAALLAWIGEYRAIAVVDASSWGLPILYFSLFAVFLCLDVVLLPELLLVEIVVLATFAISLMVVFSFWHAIIFALSSLLILAAVRGIKKDFEMNVKISIWKSFHMGKTKIILALSLLIASQYYSLIVRQSGPVTMPKFDVSSISDQFVGPMLSMINPALKSNETKNMTVDDFILSQKNIQDGSDFDSTADAMIDSQIPSSLPIEQRELIKQSAKKEIMGVRDGNNQIVLIEGRKQLSQMVGREVQGNEKINSVFSGIIDQKLNDFFQPKGISSESSFPLVIIFTIILFLTVLSIGSFLLPIWILAVIVIFRICKKLGVVQIRTVSVEKEIIA